VSEHHFFGYGLPGLSSESYILTHDSLQRLRL
jgi:hypothetical protein